MSRRLALLIGNVRYQDGRLHTPVSGKTFTALADALEAPAAGRFDDLFVLVNKPAVEVQLAFAEFLEESHEPDDLLLFYFAGHALHHNGRTFLAAWDTFSEQYLDATTIEADYIKRRFAMSQARHKLIVLDCTTSPLLPNEPALAKPAPGKPMAEVTPAEMTPTDTTPADESAANEDAAEESAADKDAANDSPTENSPTESSEAADLPAAMSQAEEKAWLAQAFEGSGAVVMAAARPFGTADGVASTFTPALTDALRSGTADRDNNQFITAGEWFAFAQKAAEASGQQCRLVGNNAMRLVVAPVPAFKGVVPILCEPLPVVDDEELVTAVPSTPRLNRQIVYAGLLVLLLLLLAGGLYSSGYWEQLTVGSSDNGSSGDGASGDGSSGDGSTEVDAATITTAVVAVLPTAEPTSTVSATKTAVTQTAVPTLTPSPTILASKATSTPSPLHLVTPSPTVTSVPVGVQIVRQLVFMRSGPAINFRIVDYLAQGTAVTVLARTESSDWYNVQLEDGRTGWVYTGMVEPPADSAPDDIPIAATLPAPADEFYDFAARPTADDLIITVGHVYAGTAGEEATFTAELLPETSLIQPTYENGQALGLGEFVVRFSRVGEGEYASTAVRLCMVSTDNEPFFCQTFPVSKEW